MAARRRVTEEDLHVTEALIADSFGKLKRSIAEAPREAVRPATNLIREHPFASTAAAAGAGVIAFQLVRAMSGGSRRRETRKSGGIMAGMVAQLAPLAAPYISGIIQQQLGKALSGQRR